MVNFDGIPQRIFEAIVRSNYLRKSFIIEKILSKNPNTVGIFRLVMKKDSDNFRESAIYDVMSGIRDENIDLLVYEPLLPLNYKDFSVTHDLTYFKGACDMILANRMDDCLNDVISKVFTRDIYGEN